MMMCSFKVKRLDSKTLLFLFGFVSALPFLATAQAPGFHTRGAAAAANTTAAAQQSQMVRKDLETNTRHFIGQGFDVIRGVVKSNCLDERMSYCPDTNRKQGGTKVSLVQNNDHLAELLHLNKGGDIPSTSKKRALYMQLVTDDSYVHVVAKIWVTMEHREMTSSPRIHPQIAEEILSPNNKNAMADFREMCGDQYLVEAEMGSELFIVYSFDAKPFSDAERDVKKKMLHDTLIDMIDEEFDNNKSALDELKKLVQQLNIKVASVQNGGQPGFSDRIQPGSDLWSLEQGFYKSTAEYNFAPLSNSLEYVDYPIPAIYSGHSRDAVFADYQGSHGPFAQMQRYLSLSVQVKERCSAWGDYGKTEPASCKIAETELAIASSPCTRTSDWDQCKTPLHYMVDGTSLLSWLDQNIRKLNPYATKALHSHSYRGPRSLFVSSRRPYTKIVVGETCLPRTACFPNKFRGHGIGSGKGFDVVEQRLKTMQKFPFTYSNVPSHCIRSSTTLVGNRAFTAQWDYQMMLDGLCPDTHKFTLQQSGIFDRYTAANAAIRTIVPRDTGGGRIGGRRLTSWPQVEGQFYLGDGFDLIKGVSKENCMDENNPGFKIVKNFSSGESVFDVQYVEDNNHLAELLDVSFAAKGSFTDGALSVGGSMERARYMKSVMDESHIRFVVKFKHTRANWKLDTPGNPLDPVVVGNLSPNDNNAKVDFREKCGDKFISSAELGASLYLVFSFDSKSFSLVERESRKEEVNAALEKVLSVGGSSSETSEMQLLISQLRIKVSASQVGGKDSIAGNINIFNVFSKYTEFIESTSDSNMAAIDFGTSHYPRPSIFHSYPHSAIFAAYEGPDGPLAEMQRYLALSVQLKERCDMWADHDKPTPPECQVAKAELSTAALPCTDTKDWANCKNPSKYSYGGDNLHSWMDEKVKKLKARSTTKVYDRVHHLYGLGRSKNVNDYTCLPDESCFVNRFRGSGHGINKGFYYTENYIDSYRPDKPSPTFSINPEHCINSKVHLKNGPRRCGFCLPFIGCLSACDETSDWDYIMTVEGLCPEVEPFLVFGSG